MAIYHLNYKHISRGKSQSACAAAAYRSATKIYDQRLGKTHNYENKQGVDYQEILAPSYAPQWVNNRPQLWNQVEAKDTRKNARPASELDIALPIELNQDQQIELVKYFAQTTLVSKGLIVDLACHDLNRHNPHAHLLFTTRKINEQGLGEKDQSLQKKSFLNDLRKTWEEQANAALSQAKIPERIDHRSLENQGIVTRLPQIHLGPNVCQMEARGIFTDRGDQWREINQANTRINQLLETKNRLEEEQENLIQQSPVENENPNQSQTKQSSNPLKNLFSPLQAKEKENNQLIINSPTVSQNQFPLHSTNPLASKSLAELSIKDGKQIKEKQAINLFHKYQPLLNQIANQVGITGNKELKLGTQNQENQWRIGINADETEFWLIDESKKETKIHLQLAENNQISLEYNLQFGEFHKLYSNLPEELELKLTNNQLKKQELKQPIEKEEQLIEPTTEELEDLTLDSPQQELSRSEYIKFIINPAVSIVARESQTFSEFVNQLEDELITVEQEQHEESIKLYYKLQLDEIIVAEDIEVREGTLPELIEKGVHYESPSENNEQRINKNHYQPDHEVIDTNPNSETEEQSRERIEEENRQEQERLRQLQEEEQRKQAQRQKSRKTKQKNKDQELEL